MTRPATLLALVLLAGCQRPTPEPQPTNTVAPSFDNAAAAQSIMQPEVAAENPPEPAPAPSPTSSVAEPVTVTFARGAVLDAAAQSSLDILVGRLSPDARLVLRGHSDSPGSDTANLAQSRRRAEAVRAYLIGRDVAPARIQVIALGERRPVAPNAQRDGSDDPAGRARNRRVEIEILPPAAMPEGPATDAETDGSANTHNVTSPRTN